MFRAECRANKRVMLIMVGIAMLAAANAVLVPTAMEAAVLVGAPAINVHRVWNLPLVRPRTVLGCWAERSRGSWYTISGV